MKITETYTSASAILSLALDRKVGMNDRPVFEWKQQPDGEWWSRETGEGDDAWGGYVLEELADGTCRVMSFSFEMEADDLASAWHAMEVWARLIDLGLAGQLGV